MSTWDFIGAQPIDANISIASGSISITAEPTDTTSVTISRGRSVDRSDDDVTDEVTVEFADRHLVVSELSRRGLAWRARDLHVRITMPDGSRAAVHAASADVTLAGSYSAVDIRTASGRVDVATVHGPAEISTMSGGVQLLEAAESSVQTASGRILVRHAVGNVTAKTASGNITVGQADASITAGTASGEILVVGLARSRAELNSVSGDIRVKVLPNTSVFLDLASVSGRVSSDLEAADEDNGANLHLQCRTVSGSVHVARAPESAEMAS
jgi:Putative adhesin